MLAYLFREGEWSIFSFGYAFCTGGAISRRKNREKYQQRVLMRGRFSIPGARQYCPRCRSIQHAAVGHWSSHPVWGKTRASLSISCSTKTAKRAHEKKKLNTDPFFLTKPPERGIFRRREDSQLLFSKHSPRRRNLPLRRSSTRPEGWVVSSLLQGSEFGVVWWPSPYSLRLLSLVLFSLF